MATAAVLAPVAVVVVLWAPVWLFAVCLFAVAALAQSEFYALGQPLGGAAYRWLGLIGAALLVAAVAWPAAFHGSAVIAAWLALGFAVLARTLADAPRMERALGRAGLTFFGLLYPAFLLALLAAARRFPDGRGWIILLFLVVWCGDTAAYYAGRAWGRHRMAPRISPKKTWEGAAASAAAAIMVAALFGGFVLRASFAVSGLLGLGLNVAAQVGDLAESVFKRGTGVKDSGALLPGHGGVLDRIDALLLAIPVLWYYLQLRF